MLERRISYIAQPNRLNHLGTLYLATATLNLEQSPVVVWYRGQLFAMSGIDMRFDITQLLDGVTLRDDFKVAIRKFAILISQRRSPNSGFSKEDSPKVEFLDTADTIVEMHEVSATIYNSLYVAMFGLAMLRPILFAMEKVLRRLFTDRNGYVSGDPDKTALLYRDGGYESGQDESDFDFTLDESDVSSEWSSVMDDHDILMPSATAE
ncbi:hypothetical protein BSLG_005994 [Batrachochytrium salamandrivorans]|nr:hypothetical protein BSLG_005994 [Batrachochytrium salamandrivorans]